MIALPRRVGIIMDGNGRWAARRRLGRDQGHRAGAGRPAHRARGARARRAGADAVRILRAELGSPRRRGLAPDGAPWRRSSTTRFRSSSRAASRSTASATIRACRAQRATRWRWRSGSRRAIRISRSAWRCPTVVAKRSCARRARSRSVPPADCVRRRSTRRCSPRRSTPTGCRRSTSWCVRRASSGSRISCCGKRPTPSSTSPTSCGPTSGARSWRAALAAFGRRQRRFGLTDAPLISSAASRACGGSR